VIPAARKAWVIWVMFAMKVAAGTPEAASFDPAEMKQ
jgi:hypothetical protein